MKTLLSAVGALLALVGASSASAADLGGSYKDGVAYSGRPVWTGIYGSAFVGGEIDTVTLSDTDIGLGPKGLFGGVRLGYDYETPGEFVFGVFGEGSLADISASAGEQSLKQDLRWGVGVRAGKAFGNTLFYVPVAYVRSHEKGDGFDWSKDLNGWRVGAGVEQQVGGGWSFGLEAGSTWYGDIGVGDGLTASTQAVDGRIFVSKHF
jgi:opacity protein-like surface antigen